MVESIKIFPSEIYCLIVPKIFVREPFSVSQASGIEKTYDKMGYVTIFRRNFFCLAVPKNFVEETLLRFTKLLVSKKLVDMWGWSKYHIFLSNFFCLTAPENFIKKPSTVVLVLGIENFYDKRGYVTISCRFFCLTVAKKLVEEPFCAVFQETSVSEKFMDKKGGEHQNFTVGNSLPHSGGTSRSGIL